MTKGISRRDAVLSLVLSSSGGAAFAAHPKVKPTLPPMTGKQILWENPGSVAQRDLLYGPGGRAGAPVAPFRFVKEDLAGTTPKVTIRDARGREWSAKWGEEVHSDIFASRLAWSVGYIAESEYYVPEGRILDVPPGSLKRAAKEIARDGYFRDSRFQLRTQIDKFSKTLDWSWTNNPFLGTAELSGLRIMMLLTSNWDNKDARDVDSDSNTAVFVRTVGNRVEYRYFVQDWGATMGRWGGIATRSKWDCIGYDEETKHFVKGVKDGYVEFGYSGKHTSDAKHDIPVQHVWWLMRYLGQISDRQLSDALRGSGATEGEERCYMRTVRRRIDQLAALRP